MNFFNRPAREREQRIVRLQSLLLRAADESKLRGFRGGSAANLERALWVARWSAELEKLKSARDGNARAA